MKKPGFFHAVWQAAVYPGDGLSPGKDRRVWEVLG
jgi:hypothetical protein